MAIEQLAAIRAREARQGRPEEMDWALAGDLRAAALATPALAASAASLNALIRRTCGE